MSRKQHWKESFPISQPEEHKVSRREMAKFACLGLAACSCAAAVRPVLFPAPPKGERVKVAHSDELAPGESMLFRYPTEDHPAILVRLPDGEYVAYTQSCTHLMCPIHYDSSSNQLVCPCHAGYFDATNGQVLAGPPPKPLPSYPVSLENGSIFVGS